MQFLCFLIFFMVSPAFAFEANISKEEAQRLTNDFLLKDIAVGETMYVSRYHICDLNGKFVLPSFTGPLDFSMKYTHSMAYLKVKRMPKFEVQIELMPPLDGRPFKELDYVFHIACDDSRNWMMADLNANETKEQLFEVISINGFSDAKSLWDSFKKVE